MNRSRRDVLEAGAGLLATAGVAGCVEKRVTRRTTHASSSTHWVLTPDVGKTLSASAFSTYTDDMQDRYGDSGVWGLEAERPQDFQTAHVQRFVTNRRTPGEPGGTESSLVPDEVEPEAPLLITDACVASYAVGPDRYRYWLWAAVDANRDELVRDVRVDELSAGVRTQIGTLTDGAEPTTRNGRATVTLGGRPSGRFPLHGGSLDTTTNRGDGGAYTVEWRGDRDGTQSVNGVCEIERSGDHHFIWALSAGYRDEQTV